MKKIFLVAALAASVAAPAAFAAKIGVVDAEQIRLHYTKAVSNDKVIKDAVADADKELAPKAAAVEKLRTDAQSVAKDIENPTLNDAARAAKRSELQTKGQEFQAAFEQFNGQRQRIAAALQQRKQQFDKEIVDDVRKQSAAVAKEKGLDLVLPQAVTLYASDTVDVTQEVLKKLNEADAANPVTPGAPITAPATK